MNSDGEWRHWGAEDPLYAVAAWKGKGKSSSSPWTSQEFLELGNSDMDDVLHHWRHYGIESGRCIEVGCGSGRMTGGLLKGFSSVMALDVSQDQISKAMSHHGDKLDRIEFRVVATPEIPAPDNSCTGMFSCHVFQHFSEFNGIVSYLRDAFRKLTSGGTVCFHIPVKGAHLKACQSDLLLGLRNLYAKTGRLLGRYKVWEYHRYPAERILAMLGEIGYRDIEMRIFPMRSNGDFHSYFFARKRSG